MTQTRDFDSLTRAWLDLMPVEAPDRVIASVLAATETMPQARRPIGGVLSRPRLGGVSLAAGAAALIVVLVGIGLGLRTAPDVGPSATPSPSPVPAPDTVPGALRSTWLGAPRTLAGLPSGTRSELVFSGRTISVGGTGFRGSVEAPGATLTITSLDEAACSASQPGRYAWEVSPRGTHLRVTPLEDACNGREVAYGGDWYRSDCHDPVLHTTCWGDLEAGTYPTVDFGPRLDPQVEPPAVFGGLTFSVPDGWSIPADHPTDVHLVHTTDAAADLGSLAVRVPNIQAWTWPTANAQRDPCSYGISAAVGNSPAALADWLGSLPALVSSQARDVTIDGRAARMIDVQIAPTWTKQCAGSTGLYLFAQRRSGSSGTESWPVGIGGQVKARAIFVDLGSGHTVMILIEAPDAGSFDGFIAEAMPIVESFHFG